MLKEEIKKLTTYSLPGIVFILLCIFIHLSGDIFQLNLVKYGIYPRRLSGLTGILFSPLIHGSYKHLFSNAVPILLLSTLILYFYTGIAVKIFSWIYFMSGFWTWCLAREAYHIGASGIAYGFAFFLFFCGIFRRDRSSIAISLLMVFLYGSMVWGILPFNVHFSWEGHLSGGIAGFIMALYFKNWNLPKPDYEWMDDEEGDDQEGFPEWKNEEEENKPKEENETQSKITYKYTYLPNKPDDKEKE